MIAEAVGAALSERARHLFAVPGGGLSLDVIDAAESRGIDVVTPHHEATAAVMAATVGRLSGSPGFALSIKGPGLANLLPGLSFAALENWPAVALCEAYPSATPASKAHKRTDHRLVTRGIVKAHATANDQLAVATATSIAMGEIPGPVCLDLLPEAPEWPSTSHDTGGSHSSHEHALDVVRAARRPVVVLGSLALRTAQISDRLNGCGIPVLTTAAAKGAIAESRENAAGVFTGVGLDLSPERRLLDEADLIVGFGLRTREVLGVETRETPVLTIDPLVGQAPGFPIVAEGGLAIVDAVVELLAHRAWGTDEVAGVVQRLDEALLAGGTFLPAEVLRSVQTLFGRDARLVVDTGDFCTIAEHVWRADGPDRYLGAGQSRYMGVGVATALAAALYDGTVPTFLAVGDGGIGPSLGELTLAVERQLPLAVLFMRDGSLASIRGRALKMGRSTRSLERTAQRWADAAAGLGFRTAVVDDQSGCQAALRSWQPGQAPLFLECRFDPNDYLVMTEGLR